MPSNRSGKKKWIFKGTLQTRAVYPHCRVSRTERRAPVRRGNTFFIYSLRDCSLIAYRGRAVKSICHRGIKHKQCQRIYRRPRYRCTRRIRIILDTLMLRARIIYLIFTVHLFCAPASDCTFTWPVVRRPTRFFVRPWFRAAAPYTSTTNRRSLTPPPAVTESGKRNRTAFAVHQVSRVPWGFLPGQFSPNERDRG